METGKQMCVHYCINVSCKFVIFSKSSSKKNLHIIFSYASGKYLRCNAVSCGVFMLCTLSLHLWTLYILSLHVHNFENVYGDFGSLVHPNHNTYNNHHVLSKVIMKNVTNLATAVAGSKDN